MLFSSLSLIAFLVSAVAAAPSPPPLPQSFTAKTTASNSGSPYLFYQSASDRKALTKDAQIYSLVLYALPKIRNDTRTWAIYGTPPSCSCEILENTWTPLLPPWLGDAAHPPTHMGNATIDGEETDHWQQRSLNPSGGLTVTTDVYFALHNVSNVVRWKWVDHTDPSLLVQQYDFANMTVAEPPSSVFDLPALCKAAKCN